MEKTSIPETKKESEKPTITVIKDTKKEIDKSSIGKPKEPEITPKESEKPTTFSIGLFADSKKETEKQAFAKRD